MVREFHRFSRLPLLAVDHIGSCCDRSVKSMLHVNVLLLSRCIKWDPLCGPLPKALTDLDLSVIEGLLHLFAESGTTLLPQCCAVDEWCQVLGPGLCGIRHACDPNIVLLASPQPDLESPRIRLVTAKAIAKGEVLSCHYGGYAGLPSQAFARGCGESIGEDLEDERQAARGLAALITDTEAGAAAVVGAEVKHEYGVGGQSQMRALLCKLVSWVTSEHWVSNACRTLLLRLGEWALHSSRAAPSISQRTCFVQMTNDAATTVPQELTTTPTFHTCGSGSRSGCISRQ